MDVTGATSSENDARWKLHQLMSPHQPRLAAFFSSRPGRLGLSLAGGSLVALMFPALIAHVALIKDLRAPQLPGVGFWQRWNWAVMYLIILPVIFAGAAGLSQTSLKIFECLTTGKFPVVKRSDGSAATGFADAIAAQASRYSTSIYWLAIILTVVLTVVDTHELMDGFYLYFRHKPHTFSHPDWSVAFDLPQTRFFFYGFHRRGAWSNLIFDILAYTAQAAAIFLGIFWIMMYWIMLNSFSTLLVNKEIEFCFHPWWDDPKLRMGLDRVGKLFNGFLLIAILFEIYVLGHRIQLIAQSGTPLASYANEIWAHPKDLGVLWKDRAFDACTSGEWLLLIFVLLPIIVMAWVPLTRFRRYLKIVKLRKYEALQVELNTYRFGTPERKEALDLWYKINTANIWPNGDFAGWSFLVLMFVLAGAAWFPPFLGYLLAGGGLTLSYRLLKRLTGKGPAPSGSDE
jgi:hypothetical protein